MLNVKIVKDRFINLHNKLRTLELECFIRLRKCCVSQALKTIKNNILITNIN